MFRWILAGMLLVIVFVAGAWVNNMQNDPYEMERAIATGSYNTQNCTDYLLVQDCTRTVVNNSGQTSLYPTLQVNWVPIIVVFLLIIGVAWIHGVIANKPGMRGGYTRSRR
jgi:hypothetical protein